MSKINSKQTRKVYGWYSPTQHKLKKEWINGLPCVRQSTLGKKDCYIYLDEYGNEAICTEVSDSNTPPSNFSDTVCLGVVIKWLRNDVKPIQNFQPILNIINMLNALEM